MNSVSIPNRPRGACDLGERGDVRRGREPESGSRCCQSALQVRRGYYPAAAAQDTARPRLTPTSVVGFTPDDLLLQSRIRRPADGRAGPPEAEHPTSLKAIADAEGLPLAYLEQVVARLRKADLVMSARGAHGGYWLARDPAEITMYDVVAGARGLDRPDGVLRPRPRWSGSSARTSPTPARAVRDQAPVDAGAGRDHPLAADDDARRARRVLAPASASPTRRPLAAAERPTGGGRPRERTRPPNESLRCQTSRSETCT